MRASMSAKLRRAWRPLRARLPELRFGIGGNNSVPSGQAASCERDTQFSQVRGRSGLRAPGLYQSGRQMQRHERGRAGRREKGVEIETVHVHDIDVRSSDHSGNGLAHGGLSLLPHGIVDEPARFRRRDLDEFPVYTDPAQPATIER